jgi:hypothetical protein
MIVEVDATAGDAGVQFFLDGEPWNSMTISGPNGRTLLEIDAKGRLKGWGLTELFAESNEPPFDEVPLEKFKKRFPEGKYTFIGTTIEGERVVGKARLSHDIPDGPEITSPADGATVGRTNVVARWDAPPEPSRNRHRRLPGDRHAVGPAPRVQRRPGGLREPGADPVGVPGVRHRVRARDPGDRGQRKPDVHDDHVHGPVAVRTGASLCRCGRSWGPPHRPGAAAMSAMDFLRKRLLQPAVP